MGMSSYLKGHSQIEIEYVLKAATYVVAALAYLSVCRYIGLVYGVLFIALTGLSVYLEYGKRYFVPRWLINFLSVSVILLSFYRVYTEDLLEPTVETLAILLAIKFLEEKKFRDYMQIYMLSVFLLTGSALLSLDFIFMLFFILIFFLVSTSIVLLTYHTESPLLRLDKDSLYKIMTRSMLIPLMSIPLTALIFLVLPRTSFHFLGFLGRTAVGRAGFADNVLLGDVSNIQLDSSIIFRAPSAAIMSSFFLASPSP
ncbi:transglutaminase domain-containing protein, partial [Candidatus Magnetobacterium bavaricum]